MHLIQLNMLVSWCQPVIHHHFLTSIWDEVEEPYCVHSLLRAGRIHNQCSPWPQDAVALLHDFANVTHMVQYLYSDDMNEG